MPGRLRHLEVLNRSSARKHQPGLIAWLLAENQGQIGIDGARFHLHRQFDRRIVEVLRQLNVIQRQRELAFHRFREGLALAFDVERRTVDGRGELRLHEDFRRVSHARNERQVQGDIADDVLLINQAIVELDHASGNLDIVEREPRRRTRLLRIGREFVQQVGKIEAILAYPHNMKFWIDQSDLVDHRPPAKQ